MIPLLLDPLLKPLLLAPLLGFLFFLFLGFSSWVPLLGFPFLGSSSWVLLLGFHFFLFLGSPSWVRLLGFVFFGSSSWVPLLGFVFLGSSSSSSGFPLLNPLLLSLLVHLLPHYITEKHSAPNILVANNKKNTYLFFNSELWDCLCTSSPSFLLVLLLVPLLPHLKRDKRTTEYDLKRQYGGNRTETLIVI